MTTATQVRSTVGEIAQYLFEYGINQDATAPTDEVGVRKLVKALLGTIPKDDWQNPDSWSQFTLATQGYIANAAKSVASKHGVPLPPDFDTTTEVEERETESKAAKPTAAERDEDMEAIPHNMKCEKASLTKHVKDIIQMYNEHHLIVPDFQRNLVWNKTMQELLIVSLLSGVPVPAITCSVEPDHADSNGNRHLIDGFQRVSTLKRFVDDEVKFNGKKFSELSEQVQNKFLFSNIDMVEIVTEKKFWPVIFRMINKGGTALSEYEILRAIYMDVPQVRILDKLTKTAVWAELFGTNNRYKGFGALLRAVSLHDFYREYKKPMKTFLDARCTGFDAKISKTALKTFEKNLEDILGAIQDRLSSKAFRLPDSKSNNLGLVDAMIHGGMLFVENGVERGSLEDDPLSEALEDLHGRLLKSDIVLENLSDDTSGAENVRERMKFVEQRVDRILKKNQEE